MLLSLETKRALLRACAKSLTQCDMTSSISKEVDKVTVTFRDHSDREKSRRCIEAVFDEALNIVDDGEATLILTIKENV